VGYAFHVSGPHGAGNALLDAVDASLRREAALEGVYQWTFHKLMSPLVAAEILVRGCRRADVLWMLRTAEGAGGPVFSASKTACGTCHAL
jgi:hypothetical protein